MSGTWRLVGLGALVSTLLLLGGPASMAVSTRSSQLDTQLLSACMGSIYGESQIANGIDHEFREADVAPALELIVAGAARANPAASKDELRKDVERAFREGHRSALANPLSDDDRHGCLQHYMRLANPVLKQQQARLQRDWGPNIKLYRTWLDDYAWSLEIARFYGDDAAGKNYSVGEALGIRGGKVEQKVSLGVAAWSTTLDLGELRDRLCPGLEQARQFCRLSETQAALRVEFNRDVIGAPIDERPGAYCILPDRNGPYQLTDADRPVFCSDLR